MADIQTGIVMRMQLLNIMALYVLSFYLYEYAAKYHKLIDKTNKLWIKTNLYTDKLLFK